MRHITPWMGILGPLPVLAGVAVAASYYGANGHHPYSFFRQPISDLGDPSRSALAWAFNAGMITSGMLMTLFLLGVSYWVNRWSAYAIGAVGVAATIAMAFVGIFTQQPETQDAHNVSAGIAFAGILILSVSLSLYLLFVEQNMLSRWVAAPSILTSLCSILFLVLLLGTRTGHLLIKRSPGPPSIKSLHNIITSLEWAVLLSVLLICFSMGVTLLFKKREQ